MNVSVRLYMCTREQNRQNDSKILKCIIYCLRFNNIGKEIASGLNVAVILKQKLYHFINCNTGNGVQHVNNFRIRSSIIARLIE